MSEFERLADQCARAGARGEAATRVRRHMLSALVCLGRHTVTRHIATCGRQWVDWSADFRLYSRGRVDTEALFGPLRRTIVGNLDPQSPVVTGLDDTRLKKSSRKTPGVKYVRDPLGPPFHVNFILAQRFVQMSMAWSNESGHVRMVPVDFCHAPSPRKPKKSADEQAWNSYRRLCRQHSLARVGHQRLCKMREALDNDGAQERTLLAVVDGGYTNGSFLKDLPKRTCVIGRIRSDAKLYHMPEEQQGKGRPRIYGPQAPTPEQLRQDPSIPWQTVEAYACGKTHKFRVKTLAPLRWRATGKQHTLRLVVVAPLGYKLRKNAKTYYRKPAYLICTDTDVSIQHILQHYIWRWDIETNFRDEKTVLGIGQAQVHHPKSVSNVPTLTVAAYAALLTAALSLHGLSSDALQLAPPKWRRQHPRRATTQDLITQLRHDLWGDAFNLSHFAYQNRPQTNPEKNRPPLHSALFYAASQA